MFVLTIPWIRCLLMLTEHSWQRFTNRSDANVQALTGNHMAIGAFAGLDPQTPNPSDGNYIPDPAGRVVVAVDPSVLEQWDAECPGPGLLIRADEHHRCSREVCYSK